MLLLSSSNSRNPKTKAKSNPRPVARCSCFRHLLIRISFGPIGRKRSTAFFDRTLSTDRPNAFGFWDSDRVRGNLVGLRKTNYNWIGIFRYIHYDPGKNPWESKRIVERFSHFGIGPAQGAPLNLIRKSVAWVWEYFWVRGRVARACKQQRILPAPIPRIIFHIE